MFDEMQTAGRVIVHGGEAAELYTTYGVPPELVETMAAEQNLAFDWDGYRQAMEEHGEESGKIADVVFKTGPIEALKKALKTTEFLGYETTEATAEIRGIVAQDHLRDELTEVGHENPVRVVLDRTPFYGETGGQVGDTGEIVGDGFEFEVTDTQKDGDLIVHSGHLRQRHDESRGEGDGPRRCRPPRRAFAGPTRRRTSCTTRCRRTLGKDAQQQGSKVDDDWLRFDFANPSPVESGAARGDRARRGRAGRRGRADRLEDRAAGRGPRGRGDDAVRREVSRPGPDGLRWAASAASCAAARTWTTPARSGRFEIVAEEGVAAGTRRITALTGAKAQEHISQNASGACRDRRCKLGVGLADVPAAAKRLAQHVRDLKKALASGGKTPDEPPPVVKLPTDQRPDAAQIKAALRDAARAAQRRPVRCPGRASPPCWPKSRSSSGSSPTAPRPALCRPMRCWPRPRQVGGATVIVAEAPGANANLMRQLIDQIRKKTSPSAVFLATTEGDRQGRPRRRRLARPGREGRQRRQLGARRGPGRRRRRRRQARPGPGRRQGRQQTARRAGQGPRGGPGDAGGVRRQPHATSAKTPLAWRGTSIATKRLVG